MIDSVCGALSSRGDRAATEVLAELGVDVLIEAGGSLFDAALVAEAAGREGVLAYDEPRILVSAACVGMAQRALEEAAVYARERVVFGRPIGEYQGVAHKLADAATEIEGTRLLVWRAIAARAEALPDAARLDAQAFWWAARACIPAIRAAMRVFGGYGMSEDSPLPRLYRTARAALLSGGDADRVLTAPLPELSSIGAVPISFTQDDTADRWEARARAFIATHFSEAEKRAFAHSRDNHIPDLHRRLAAAGLLYPDWPTEFGGEAASPFATSAVRKVLGRAGWPISVLVVSDMVGKLLMQFGTPEAKAEILPRLARGESICCLGMSEPSGGSDVFAARTRARHDGARWIANGQKVFTTSAHIADYVLLLTRTDGGLTLFVAPLTGDGFDYNPVETFAGERTNITFYSDFPIEDRYLLGEADRGGKVLGATLSLEHNLGDYYLGALGSVQDELAQALPQIMALAGLAKNEPAIRHSLARLDAYIALLESLSIRSLWAGGNGVSKRWYGPMCKLFGTESWGAICAELVERLAPHSLNGGIDALAVLELEARRGIPATIYGGTSEIQRSVIAETAFKLPKSR